MTGHRHGGHLPGGPQGVADQPRALRSGKRALSITELSDYPRCYLDADDPLHAFQGYGSVDAREMPLELSYAGSLAPRGVNLANSFGNRAVYSEHSARMIRP